MSEWNEAEQHAERAQRFYRAGQWERALAELREALDQRPEEGEWWFGLGLTLDALGRYQEATEAYQKALHERGEDVPVLLHLGIDLIRAGQPEAAISTLARVNQLDAAVELGYVHRILAHALIGQHDQAELMFYLARQFADVDAPAKLYEDPAEEQGDIQEPKSADDFNASHARDQIQAMAFDYLGQSLAEREDYDRAEWCWHEALSLDPSHAEANRSLALLHQQRGQLERARLHFQRQLRITPWDIDTLMESADLMMQLNRLAEAGDKYRQALECDGTLAVAHERLGQLALINGHVNAAADRFERARQLDPAYPGVCLGLALTAHQRGDTQTARDWLHQELELEGQTAEQSIEIASLLVEFELYPEAIRLLNPLISGADDLIMNHNKLYAEALLYRGVARIAQGKLEPGMADCHRCINLESENTTAIFYLADAYLQLGNLSEARQWVREGLALAPADADLLKLRQKLRRARWADRLRRLLGRRPTR